jgi:hypothetical protein
MRCCEKLLRPRCERLNLLADQLDQLSYTVIAEVRHGKAGQNSFSST